MPSTQVELTNWVAEDGFGGLYCPFSIFLLAGGVKNPYPNPNPNQHLHHSSLAPLLALDLLTRSRIPSFILFFFYSLLLFLLLVLVWVSVACACVSFASFVYFHFHFLFLFTFPSVITFFITLIQVLFLSLNSFFHSFSLSLFSTEAHFTFISAPFTSSVSSSTSCTLLI
jgi:hypothetical protein